MAGINIVDIRVVAIGAAECTLTFEATVEAEHLITWTEVDREGEVERELLLEDSPFSGTAKVALNASSLQIDHIISMDLDETEFKVTENPRHRWKGTAIRRPARPMF